MRILTFWILGMLLAPPLMAEDRRGNLVRSPSFEQGTDGWTSRRHPGWHDFAVDSKHAHSGSHSAQTRLEKHPVSGGAQIWGAIQEISVSKLPRKIGVWYRVENWKQAVAKQYAQVVVMIHDERLKKITTQPQMQVRYIIAGLSEPPYHDPVNGRYVMAGPKSPKEGRWIYFERNLIDDFIRTWGWYPENFQKMEVFFESRYDEPVPDGVEISGTVYWDDAVLLP